MRAAISDAGRRIEYPCLGRNGSWPRLYRSYPTTSPRPNACCCSSRNLTYLDEVHRQVQALPVPAEIRDAAIRQERRLHPSGIAQGDTARQRRFEVGHGLCGNHRPSGAVGQAVDGIRRIFRNTWRASSLRNASTARYVCSKPGYRKMTQGLLDLKLLSHWNTHTFRTGRRRGRSLPTDAWMYHGRTSWAGGTYSNGHLNNSGRNCPPGKTQNEKVSSGNEYRQRNWPEKLSLRRVHSGNDSLHLSGVKSPE